MSRTDDGAGPEPMPAGLRLPGRSLAGFDFGAVPVISRARVMAPAAGDARLARYHLPILDDPAHVGKDQVLFELVPAGCGRRSLMITAGRVFPERDRILPDRTMAVAAAGRPVHRAVIPGMNVESHRRRTALETRKRGRPASRATRKNTQTGRAAKAAHPKGRSGPCGPAREDRQEHHRAVPGSGGGERPGRRRHQKFPSWWLSGGRSAIIGSGGKSACNRREIRKISGLPRRRVVILIDVLLLSGLSLYTERIRPARVGEGRTRWPACSTRRWRHPVPDPDVRRTPERRIRGRKAQHGADKEVMFAASCARPDGVLPTFTRMTGPGGALPAGRPDTCPVASGCPGPASGMTGRSGRRELHGTGRRPAGSPVAAGRGPG